jgi:hypothetical protein
MAGDGWPPKIRTAEPNSSLVVFAPPQGTP